MLGLMKIVKERACTVTDDVTTCKIPTNGFAEEDQKSECFVTQLDVGGKQAETYD
jgi:hypothetical protein